MCVCVCVCVYVIFLLCVFWVLLSLFFNTLCCIKKVLMNPFFTRTKQRAKQNKISILPFHRLPDFFFYNLFTHTYFSHFSINFSFFFLFRLLILRLHIRRTKNAWPDFFFFVFFFCFFCFCVVFCFCFSFVFVFCGFLLFFNSLSKIWILSRLFIYLFLLVEKRKNQKINQ